MFDLFTFLRRSRENWAVGIRHLEWSPERVAPLWAVYSPELVRTLAVDRLAAMLRRVASTKGSRPIADRRRLDLALLDLAAAGHLVQTDFMCCSTCALDEINCEFTSPRNIQWRGYVYYHKQDTEAAEFGDGLYLGFGAHQSSGITDTAVGHEAVAALKRYGLNPDWDEDFSTRIFIPMDWAT